MSAASHAYAERARQLRKRASRVASQQELNAILLLIPNMENRKAIYDMMWPHLPNPEWTCPEGPAHDVVGN